MLPKRAPDHRFSRSQQSLLSRLIPPPNFHTISPGLPLFSPPEMEPRVEGRDLVIKVKYGDTLRRFGTHIHAQAMDHDMIKLRAQIIHLFKLSPDADLILTYTDEDGDVVTLDNDEELHDAAISQHLNPLRINVLLRTCEISDPKSQNQFSSGVDEAMKSFSEPLRGALLKLSQDLESKAASSVPALAELVEYFSKFGVSDVNQGTSSGPSANLMDFTVDGPTTTVDPLPTTVLQGTTNPGTPEPILKPNGRGVATHTHADLNPNPPRNPNASEFPSISELLSCNWTMATNLSAPPSDQAVDHNSRNYVASNPNPCPTVPFTRIPLPTPWRRPHSYHATFHRHVRCDGCGMKPIMGPRFKSNVKEDYDLCSFCFSKMGNGTDYTVIERAPYQSSRLLKKYKNPQHPRCGIPQPRPFHGRGMKPSGDILESCFIRDVTIADGTVVAPCTPFTKIWRMRNNGASEWPIGTQLLWTGGDHFGTWGSAKLVVPIDFCPVNEEIDIVADFTSPSEPGSYTSYWRLASRSGRPFGQEIWVEIQVENPQPNSASAGFSFHADLNLNLPPESSSRNGLGMIDVNVEPSDAIPSTSVEPVLYPVIDLPDPLSSSVAAMDENPVEPVSYPVIDLPESLSSSVAAMDVNPLEQSLMKELEEMGFQQIDLNKEVLRQNEYNLEQSVDDLCGFVEWDPLLAELKEMGFNDNKLNKKLLVKNGGSIKRVVLDLIVGEKGE